MIDLHKVVSGMAGREHPGDDVPVGAQTNYRWTVAGSVPIDEDNSLGRVLDLIHDSLAALRQSTGVSIPSFSIERVWPIYLIAYSEPDGSVEMRNIAIVEHGRFGGLPPATEDDLRRAAAVRPRRREVTVASARAGATGTLAAWVTAAPEAGTTAIRRKPGAVAVAGSTAAAGAAGEAPVPVAVVVAVGRATPRGPLHPSSTRRVPVMVRSSSHGSGR